MQSVRQFEPSQELVEEMEGIAQQATATQFHLKSLVMKAIRTMSQSRLNRLAFQQRVFALLAQQVNMHKVRKTQYVRSSSFFEALRQNQHRVRLKRERDASVSQLVTQCCRRKHFQAWSRLTATHCKQALLRGKRSRQLMGQFMMLLRQYKVSREMLTLELGSQMYHSREAHAVSLQRKALKGLAEHRKQRKLVKYITRTRLKEVVSRVKRFNDETANLVAKFSHRSVKQTFFWAWKEHYRTNLAYSHYRSRLLGSAFQTWHSNLEALTEERQVDQANESIVSIFREQSMQAQLRRMLASWQVCAAEKKAERKRSQVASRSATLKYREILLRRCFRGLRQEVLLGQVDRDYYWPVLTRKALQGMREAVRLRGLQQEQACEQMRLRRMRVCFQGLRTFIRSEREKVSRHRLRQQWGVFSLALASQYFHRQSKASHFARTSLLFRCFYALKSQLAFTKRLNYLVGEMNVRRPMHRWWVRHRVEGWVRQRQWMRGKAMVREWKLQVVRQVSAKKVVSESKGMHSTREKGRAEERAKDDKLDTIMQTVARIRKDLISERQDSSASESMRWPVVHTPEQSFNFSYSLQG